MGSSYPYSYPHDMGRPLVAGLALIRLIAESDSLSSYCLHFIGLRCPGPQQDAGHFSFLYGTKAEEACSTHTNTETSAKAGTLLNYLLSVNGPSDELALILIM